MSIIDTPLGGIIKNRAKELEPIRNKYRDRAREYSKVTLPYLVPEVEDTTSNEFQHDYNTEGAKLVNSLSNTYVETLFPAGRSFVKLMMETEDYAAQEQQGNDKADIESIFGVIERDFRYKFELVNSRPVMLDALKHLIVSGNVCLYKPKDGNLQSYAVDEFSVLRSLDGTLMEVVTEDKKFLGALDPEVRQQVAAALKLKEDDLETVVSLYTWIRRDPDNPDKWYADQAVEDVPVGEQNNFNTDNMRWMPVMWNRTRRELYGRGLVEEHYGSFWTLSILSEALAVGCVSLADIKYLVRPGSLVNVQELNSSQTGSYHYGEADDINAISTDRSKDIVLIKDVIEIYKRHLAEVFMYLPGTMRDAERVTAEENRLRARSLEKAHGGVYSSLSATMQRPYAKLLFDEMNVTGLEAAGVKIAITTGLDALSRGNENDKINHWFADLSQMANVPPQLLSRIKQDDFMKTTASGRDVDFAKFMMTEEEFNSAQAQAQEQGERNATGEAMVKNAEPEQLAQAMQQG